MVNNSIWAERYSSEAISCSADIAPFHLAAGNPVPRQSAPERIKAAQFQHRCTRHSQAAKPALAHWYISLVTTHTWVFADQKQLADSKTTGSFLRDAARYLSDSDELEL